MALTPLLPIGARAKRSERWGKDTPEKRGINHGTVIGHQAGKDNHGKAVTGYLFQSDFDLTELQTTTDEWDRKSLAKGVWYTSKELEKE
jgi:hypothetical protein